MRIVVNPPALCHRTDWLSYPQIISLCNSSCLVITRQLLRFLVMKSNPLPVGMAIAVRILEGYHLHKNALNWYGGHRRFEVCLAQCPPPGGTQGRTGCAGSGEPRGAASEVPGAGKKPGCADFGAIGRQIGLKNQISKLLIFISKFAKTVRVFLASIQLSAHKKLPVSENRPPGEK